MWKCLVVALVASLAFRQDDPPKDPPPRQDPPRQPAPPREDPKLAALAKKCGNGIPWKTDFKAALKLAKDQGRLIFGYVYDRSRSSMFGNAFKDDFMKAGPFIDQDLVNTISRKFIPLRIVLDTDFLTMDGDGDVMLVTPEGERALKLNDVTVPGFIFITPEGRVVTKFDSIAVASSDLIFHVCRSVLAKFRDFDKPGAGLVEAKAESTKDATDLRSLYKLGLEYMKDGEFERAMTVFGDVIKAAGKDRDAVESGYRLAGCLRRLRKPKEALDAIRAARKLNEDVGAKFEGDMILEEAILELKQGREEASEKLLKEMLDKHPKANRAPEASFLLGAIAYLSDREKQAKETWDALIKSNPESQWACKAASEMLDRGPLSNGWEDFEWLPESLLTGNSGSTERRRKPEERPDAIKEGVDYLIRKQRGDGSWRNVKGQFDFRESITILAALALWECRDVQPEANAKAREKALAFFDKWLEKKAPTAQMGIWPYVNGLHVFARLAKAHEGDQRKAFLAKAMICFEGIKKAQLFDGTWSYVGKEPTPFITAPVIVHLKELKDLGAEIPEKVVDEAIKGLVTMKGPAREPYKIGIYWYFHQATDQFDHGAPEGGAGRSPMAYWAEFSWDKCKAEELAEAMQMFMDHKIRLMRVRKTTDWHAGKFANAPYFFFFDYYYSSEVNLLQKPDVRKKNAQEITKDLMNIGEIDGSWLDWHIGGKGYGTAMALMVLKNCEKAEK